MTRNEARLLELVREGFLEVRDDGTIWRLMATSRKGKRRRIEHRMVLNIWTGKKWAHVSNGFPA